MHLVEQAQAGVLELINLSLQVLGADITLASLVLSDDLSQGSDLLLDLVSLSLVETVLELSESLLGIVEDGVGTVGGLDSLLAGLISTGVLLSVVNHALDLGVRETGARSDSDGLILVGGLVLGVNVNDGVSVNVEGDLDLGDTTVGGGNADKLEVAEHLVVTDKLTLTLEDLDLDGSLEVSGGGEDLRLLGGDGGVAVDQTSEDTTEGLDTERQGSDIQQENVSDLTSQNSTLDSSTNGNGLVRVDRLGGVTAEDGLDGLSDLRHTGHTTDKDDLLDVLSTEVSILESLADRLDSASDERVDKLLQLGTGELDVNVLSTRSIGCDEGQVDLSLNSRRQLDLGLLSGLTDTLDSHAVTGQVNAGLALELLDDLADERDIKVLTTQVSITIGRFDLEDTLLDLEDGDIESTTTEIVDGDDTVLLLLQTVGQGSSSGLVNNTQDVQTSDGTSILGSLSLGVVEVSGDGNNAVLDGLVEVGLSSLLHLLQDEATNLGGRVLLAMGLNPGVTVVMLDNLVRDLTEIALDLRILELTTNETLSSEESVLGVDNSLALSGNTDETLTLLGHGNNGRRCAGT